MLPTRKTRGFTLIATLMLLLIVSGIAIGLLMIWGGQTLNYKGSMASLYYSKRQQHYLRSPARNYIFDHLFTQPPNLPPGMPWFRDIDNLSYRQSFTPHTGCY
jgi:hypothetical protein